MQEENELGPLDKSHAHDSHSDSDLNNSPTAERRVSYAPDVDHRASQERSMSYSFTGYSFGKSGVESSEHKKGGSRASGDEKHYHSSPYASRHASRQSVRRMSRRVSSVAVGIANAAHNIATAARKSSVYQLYETAKVRGAEMQRKKWAQVVFEYSMYTILVLILYFVLIVSSHSLQRQMVALTVQGLPLWKGATYWLYYATGHKFVLPGGFAITIGIAFFYAFSPLLVIFEPDIPMPPEDYDPMTNPKIKNTA